MLVQFINQASALLLRHSSIKQIPHAIVIRPNQPVRHHAIYLHVKHPLLIKQRNIHLNLSWKTFHFPIFSHCCQSYSFICPSLCTTHIDGHFENNHYAHMGPCSFFEGGRGRMKSDMHCNLKHYSFTRSCLSIFTTKMGARAHARTHAHYQSSPIRIVSNDTLDTLPIFKRSCYK